MEIDSHSLDVCKVCGALVWWNQITKHAEWHAALTAVADAHQPPEGNE